ncbi:Uncharacterized protein, contains a NRPS condensation (elongation) domain [Butyrivibrio proteoclasticus]|uniref:Uncharacterized protein, contains a NRPS condensation (Elongation) domain n=1 Tax=Butyrivibrio proteoclasticus TaxID=43305 RepID=A0A1I5WY14_9FIRM|nr:hypothetical protein [Butyrivibrio proteoclasticus]SFQ24521.1 Uncharacterized protein, contains a NRPS condensation (elongation) domain [Butyrivibrio proteoclasticus]
MERKNWYKLDNAAKIVPSTARGANTRVFRLTCELKEKVEKDMLQIALDETIDEFPFFNCVLHRGIFWYYLEDSDLRPVVELEHTPACMPLYIPGHKNLLYRVNYFDKRINLEMFHVLADGTGAFMFFKTLIIRYLQLKHSLSEDIKPVDEFSVEEKNVDAFTDNYSKQKGLKQLKEMSSVKAYQVSGELDENLLPHLLEGTVSSSKFLELAHQHNTTVGVLCVAIYIKAAILSMNRGQKKRHVVVSVPVNLRQFYHSGTARNFFGVINIDYDPANYDGNLATIIEPVDKAFKEKLSAENIEKTMNSYSALEHNLAVKVVPLPIKDFTIGRFDAAAKKGVTTSMSNIGRIKMPKEVEEYIDRFSAFMTASSQQVTVCSFGDKMTFGEASPFKTHRVMLNFFRCLSEQGIEVELGSNDYDEEVSE